MNSPKLPLILFGLFAITDSYAGPITLKAEMAEPSNPAALYAEFADEKPKVVWKGDKLIVRALGYSTSTHLVTTDSPSLSLDGNGLRICYRLERQPHRSKSGPIAAFAFPVQVVFEVSGLEKKDYAISVEPCAID